MVELRKRPPPKETTDSAPSAKRSNSSSRAGGAAGAAAAPTPAQKALSRAKRQVTGAGLTKQRLDAGHASVKGGGAAGTAEKGGAQAEGTAAAAAPAATEESGEAKAEEEKVEGATTADDDIDAAAAGGQASIPLSEAAVGKSIADLAGFGGTIKTHAGEDTTFKALLGKSAKGVVIFTYPKASTPGCTTQACLFRDSYEPLTSAGLAVYGLSTDSPKANTTFATKQNLQYELLCDPDAGLTGALGLKKSVGKGTQRGVVVISKEGKVEAWLQGGPQKTLDVVLEWLKK